MTVCARWWVHWTRSYAHPLPTTHHNLSMRGHVQLCAPKGCNLFVIYLIADIEVQPCRQLTLELHATRIYELWRLLSPPTPRELSTNKSTIVLENGRQLWWTVAPTVTKYPFWQMRSRFSWRNQSTCRTCQTNVLASLIPAKELPPYISFSLLLSWAILQKSSSEIYHKLSSNKLWRCDLCSTIVSYCCQFHSQHFFSKHLAHCSSSEDIYYPQSHFSRVPPSIRSRFPHLRFSHDGK